MKRLLTAFSFVFLFSSNFNLNAEKKIPAEARATMSQFLAQFLELQPFMVSTKEIESKQERQKIAKELRRLTTLSKKLQSLHQFESTGFRISAEILTDELATASRAFDSGNLGYARRTLRSTLDVCSSCHSQVPETPTKSWMFDESALKGTRFQRAEFLFSTRQYGPALKLYKEFAEEFDGAQDPLELEMAISRIIATNVRVLRNPKEAREELQKLQTKTQYSDVLKTKIGSWIDEVRATEKISSPDIEKISAKDLTTFVSKDFSDKPTLVQALYYSGLLYQFLHSRPKKDVTGDILYWLSFYEGKVGENFPVELSRLYLKECVLQFGKDPIAQKCFAEFENLQTLEYTGSAGTKIPADIKKEIDSLRSKLGAPKK